MLAADSKVASATTLNNLKRATADSWKKIIGPVEPFLEAVEQRLGSQVEAFEGGLAEYADYALNGQGKHLRPALVALSAKALGQVTDAHVTVAVIIETVHLATLLHDDVIDEAEIRRGRPTLAANWGNEIAVLFGDCLFAHALKLAASFPTPEICRAVASATNTVCSGEILQTQHRRDFRFTRAEYFKVLEMKTAELFALSCELAACLNGTALDERFALRQFGLAFGTAYQLYDDCVDLFGSEAIAGKSLGTDLAKGKLTLPVLLVWEKANAEEQRRLKQMVEDWKGASFRELKALLLKYQALDASLGIIREYLWKAGEALQSLPHSEGRTGLLALADYLEKQTGELGVCA
jgi:octaprenyl-diphosphate synthase